MLLTVNTRPRAGETREQLIEHLTRRLDPSTWDLIRHGVLSQVLYKVGDELGFFAVGARAPKCRTDYRGTSEVTIGARAPFQECLEPPQEQTSASAVPMSQNDPKRTSRHCEPMIATLRCQWPIAAPTLARIQATPTWPSHI